MAGISRFMLQDSPMNIESHILNILKDAFARYEAKQMLYGNGVNKPLGVLAVPNKTTSDTAEWSDTAIQTVQSGSATDVLIGTESTGLLGARTALSAYYTSNAKWYMSQETFTQIQSLNANTTYHFLEMQPSSNKEGRPSYVLLGWPVEILPEMLSNTTGKVVIFGDMAQALQIYDHTSGVHLLKDEISNYDEVTYVATQRWGAKVIKPEALKIIKLGT
jgi:HK97 family phage major capsid protein